MARIAGVNVPDNKHAGISLTYIFGIGRSTAHERCVKMRVAATREDGHSTPTPSEGKA